MDWRQHAHLCLCQSQAQAQSCPSHRATMQLHSRQLTSHRPHSWIHQCSTRLLTPALNSSVEAAKLNASQVSWSHAFTQDISKHVMNTVSAADRGQISREGCGVCKTCLCRLHLHLPSHRQELAHGVHMTTDVTANKSAAYEQGHVHLPSCVERLARWSSRQLSSSACEGITLSSSVQPLSAAAATSAPAYTKLE